MNLADPASISSWHAHVYFDAASRDQARALREAILAGDAPAHLVRDLVTVGRFHERPVGPHPMWSFQLAFGADSVGMVLGWLVLNHGALDVFLHPNTGDALRDHRDAAVWLGRSHTLVLSALND